MKQKKDTASRPMELSLKAESSEQAGRALQSSMPFLRPSMQSLKYGDPGDFRSTLPALQPLAQLIERTVPADLGGNHSRLADAFVAASQADDRQPVVAEFVAEL